LRVLEKGHQYDGRNKFSTWLFSIAHNVAIDYLRKRQPASLDAINEQDDGPMIDPPAEGPSAFDLLARKETAQQIETAMERVPVVYREVLVLRFQEQMKLEEIAQLIHIPLATVKTRLYRGVMALRPAFQAGAR
jgi:RNA polymerase sigma-70 factor (ECF subfamily)